ncbi:hypothetical protein [Limosilactobacillus reuteri]|uniref:hypothetical protein n=1 Tax=Limosilactobacillus reuteri TaxID=1598 RepID=UPI001E4AE8E7|nr:hypothetical protein [Limosilactobacillus reuteri]MCC4466855.1 hypothetical protein [Limosilactobacillus reuteri]MCC4472899.1 hypothetical protein [Limosilactobacillus reuteri]
MARKAGTFCVICGKSKRDNEFISHKNNLFDSKFSICRDCANEKANFDDIDSIIAMCELANLPYRQEIVEKLIRDDKEPDFGKYLRRLAPNNKFNSFKDSSFNDNAQSDNASTIKSKEEIEQRWGEGYTHEKYKFFEKQLAGLTEIKPPTTSLEYERYIQNIKLKDVLNEALQAGDSKAIPQLRKSYNDDLKELGFDSVLNAKDDSGESLGQKIQKFEMKSPIPDRGEFNDVSGISKYIAKWFVIPLKRTFGVANEEEVSSLYDTKD